MKIKGKAIKFGNNIDTDVILPGKYMTIVDPNELAKHALESLDPEFPQNAKEGVILVGGKNFGCGSSREYPTSMRLLAMVVTALVPGCYCMRAARPVMRRRANAPHAEVKAWRGLRRRRRRL